MQKNGDQHDPGADHPFLFAVDRRRRDLSPAPALAPDHGHALAPAAPLAPGGPGFMAKGETAGRIAGLGDREYNNHAAGLCGLHARRVERLSWIEAAVFSYRLDALVHGLGQGFSPLIKRLKNWRICNMSNGGNKNENIE